VRRGAGRAASGRSQFPRFLLGRAFERVLLEPGPSARSGNVLGHGRRCRTVHIECLFPILRGRLTSMGDTWIKRAEDARSRLLPGGGEEGGGDAGVWRVAPLLPRPASSPRRRRHAHRPPLPSRTAKQGTAALAKARTRREVGRLRWGRARRSARARRNDRRERLPRAWCPRASHQPLRRRQPLASGPTRHRTRAGEWARKGYHWRRRGAPPPSQNRSHDTLAAHRRHFEPLMGSSGRASRAPRAAGPPRSTCTRRPRARRLPSTHGTRGPHSRRSEAWEAPGEAPGELPCALRAVGNSARKAQAKRVLPALFACVLGRFSLRGLSPLEGTWITIGK
jgi:hypothetical protein